MPSMQEIAAMLPQSVQAGLDSYVTSLHTLYGDNLLSVILYGSAARGDYIAGVSDLNVLIVLRDAHIQQVKLAADLSIQARDKHAIEPRFMSLETIETASDVLPIAFLDMQEQYVVLHGDDVLNQVVIERRNLRFQCEYQLRFMLLRMRNLYLFSRRDQRLMAAHLSRSFTSLLHLLRSLYRLLDEPPPTHMEEVIARSAERFGLDHQLMGELLNLKRKQKRFHIEGVESLFEGYLDLLYDLIQVVDNWM